MADEGAEERRTRIDWPATFAGAGAAVTVAVLLSTLGAAGTLIGAALGSVVATVSTALYKQGIESSRRRMAEVQAAAVERVNLAEQNVRRAARRSDPEAVERELDRAHRHLEEADEEELEAAPGPGSSRWAALPWKQVAVLAAAVFLLAVLVISAIELIAGRSVSTITGGTDGKDRTSISGVFGDGGGKGTDKQRQELPAGETPTPTPTPTGSDTGTAVPTEPAATDTPTEVPSPTETATVTETVTPTPAPSATPSPSATTTP